MKKNKTNYYRYNRIKAKINPQVRMLVLEQTSPKIKIDVNANRGLPTWKPPPNGDGDKWGSDWKVRGNFHNTYR
jgi:hypothetical protein